MGTRLQLHQILCDILGSDNVYFQPPEDGKMKYPAILYSRDDIETFNADDIPYRNVTGYMITVIDRDPDSEIVPKIAALPLCRYDRHYKADNLNHDVFTIYY